MPGLSGGLFIYLSHTANKSWTISYAYGSFLRAYAPLAGLFPHRPPGFHVFPRRAQVVAAVIDQVERIGHIGLDGTGKQLGHGSRGHGEFGTDPAPAVEGSMGKEQLPDGATTAELRALQHHPNDSVGL